MAARRPKVCFDRILPSELMSLQRTLRGREGRVRAMSPIGKAWMNGSTLRVRFMGGTAAQQKKTREQAGWWSESANIKFDFNDAPDADVRIAFDAIDGAWSYIGTDCRGIARKEPTMNLGFLDGGTAAHEFGHTLGLAHEHQNPAGGMQWNEKIVIGEMAKSPNFWDEQTTRHNIMRKYSADQVNGTRFDPESVMLYFFPASWTLNNVGTKENEKLSALDKDFIASAKMYPRARPGIGDALALEVNARRRTEGAIGKAGEEDLYRFTAKSDGRYVIDTAGPTDMFMKLFGPDSETALIAQDNDSGIDANARIAADLVAGNYFVQVRHFQPTGKGNYTIKVRKV